MDNHRQQKKEDKADLVAKIVNAAHTERGNQIKIEKKSEFADKRMKVLPPKPEVCDVNSCSLELL